MTGNVSGLTPVWAEPPGENALQRLRHTLHAYAAEPDDWMVLMATSNVYGEGVKTGLTLGDLRRIEAGVSQIEIDQIVRTGPGQQTALDR